MKILLLLSVAISFAIAMDYSIKNTGKEVLWIGIQGSPNFPSLAKGGFILKPGEEKMVVSEFSWDGRFWARTMCDPKTKICKTGSCGNKVECNGAGPNPPVTIVEMAQRGGNYLIKESRKKNFYGISLLDGFNIQASIKPIGGEGDCLPLDCPKNINEFCPDLVELRVQEGSQVIACKSACLAYKEDEPCCVGNHNHEGKCIPRWWKRYNTALLFKTHCPDAYSYEFDSNRSKYTCRAERYNITFG